MYQWERGISKKVGKQHGYGGQGGFSRKSMKNFMNLLHVGVFLNKKKEGNLAHFSKLAIKNSFSLKYMADYAFGKC